MPRAVIEDKVRRELSVSGALPPIEPADLQAELDRMRMRSKNPKMLSELFDALGNDSMLAAECLARPTLIQRSHRASASGREQFLDRVHLAPLDSIGDAEANELRLANEFDCSAGACELSFGLEVPDDRYHHTAVWTGAEMIVWGGMAAVPLNTGGRYDPATDLWSSTSLDSAPAPRADHTAVWTGTEMLVWGGNGGSSGDTNTGGRYNPATDSWSATSQSSAPSPRESPTAVWTGTEMLVWGGTAGGFGLRTGGRYNPSTDSWRPINLLAAPSERVFQTAVWTGTRMVVWGGWSGSGTSTLNTGGRYDPSTDSWSPTTMVSAPDPRFSHSAVWTGTEMVVWGGIFFGVRTNTGGRYDPATDSWHTTSLLSVPAARYLHTAVWTGTEMIVWGGNTSAGVTNTGGRYNPSTDSWSATSAVAAPSERQDHAAVWTDTEMLVWGGDFGSFAHFGGRYDPQTDAWSTLQSSLRWVALGDSYSSGEGAGSYEDTNRRYVNECHRSLDNSWSGRAPGGSEVAQVLPSGSSGELIACSGSRSRHLWQPRFFGKDGSGDENNNGLCDAGEPCVAAQLVESRLLGSADLVTLTTGGNDLVWDDSDDADGMFATIASECATGPPCKPEGPYGTNGTEMLGAFALRILQRLNDDESTEGSLRYTYKLVKELAPNATVIVINYPTLFWSNPLGNSCLFQGFDANEMVWLNEFATDLQNIIRCAAESQGVQVVPVSFGNNALCKAGPPSERWLHGVTGWPWSRRKESLHPNALGQVAMASALRGHVPMHGINNPPPKPCDYSPGSWMEASSDAAGIPTHNGVLHVEANVAGCGLMEDTFAKVELVTLSGAGFAPAAQVSLTLNAALGSYQRNLGQITVDAAGALNISLILPPDTPESGLAVLEAIGPLSNGESLLLKGVFELALSSSTELDGDGVPDICDNCVSLPNVDQLNADGDALGDGCDACAVDPLNDFDGDGLCSDHDPCPLDSLNDLDGDGLCAESDSCDAVAGDDCMFADGFETGSASAWFDSVP